jgi:hypothetical protein
MRTHKYTGIHTWYGRVRQVKLHHQAAEEGVAQQHPHERRRSLLDARPVVLLQPPARTLAMNTMHPSASVECPLHYIRAKLMLQALCAHGRHDHARRRR